MAFADLTYGQGNENMSSIRGDVYLCPVSDIDFSTVPTLAADGVTITGDIVCISTKKFIGAFQAKGLGKINSAVAGERYGKYKENSIEFFFPGNAKEVIAFEKQALNTEFVVIVKEADGTTLVIGLNVDAAGTLNLDLPATLETADYVNEKGSVRGRNFVLMADAAHSPLVYEGDIQITPTI